MDEKELKSVTKKVIFIFILIDVLLAFVFFISYMVTDSLNRAAFNLVVATIFLSLLTILLYFAKNVIFRNRNL